MEAIDGYTMFDRTWVEIALIVFLIIGIFTFVEICMTSLRVTFSFIGRKFSERKSRNDEQLQSALNRIANVLEKMEGQA